MKKRSFQKSMLMGNTAVVTLVVVVLFICANLYLIHEDAKRIQQQTESNASSILRANKNHDWWREWDLPAAFRQFIYYPDFWGAPKFGGQRVWKIPGTGCSNKGVYVVLPHQKRFSAYRQTCLDIGIASSTRFRIWRKAREGESYAFLPSMPKGRLASIRYMQCLKGQSKCWCGKRRSG